ncbi:unnamed protein product [Sphenostylis stenocarpa]|uniref:Calcium-transporting P-type ATPase N-terminal autoinhibitory domain-containing protein n=1 Tax=Sphenostylis stenocarpa TaxID=92480 RepID=A0AA86V3A0_9FABA|nr:unnamed protein product [Sphenostylis stenocarpa]
MESALLKEFQLQHKNPSLEALLRWRSAVTLVKNHRRRFRMVADLDKRVEAQRIRQGIKNLRKHILSELWMVRELKKSDGGILKRYLHVES